MGGAPLRRRELFVALGFGLGAILAIIGVWLAFGGTLPFAAQGYRLTIAFPQAPTLVAGADVRISGVPVGTVVSVKAGVSSTNAVIQLQGRFAPLPADARAIVRTKTPLGESYVDITPGTRTAPRLRDGGTLPAAQVAPTQQIQDVLQTFDARTRRGLQTLTADSAAALRGEGEDLNTALGASGDTSAQLGVLLAALRNQGGDVRTLVADSTTALRALDAQPAALDQLIAAGNAVTATTAQRSLALTRTVRALEPFVHQLALTAPVLAHTATLATPSLQTLAPVAPLALPGLRAVEALSPPLTATLRALPGTIAVVDRTLPDARTILTTVPSAGSALTAASRELVPLVQLVQAYDHDAVESLASFGSVLEPVKGSTGGTYARYARTAIVAGTEGDLGFKRREPSNRYNPYPPPGQLGDGKSLSCANTANPATLPQTGTQVPCVVEAPWLFRGATRSFPSLTPYAPDRP